MTIMRCSERGVGAILAGLCLKQGSSTMERLTVFYLFLLDQIIGETGEMNGRSFERSDRT